jgi:hypothetical protein
MPFVLIEPANDKLISFFTPAGCVLNLKIFLDEKSLHCLKRSVPRGSRSKFLLVLEEDVLLKLCGNDVVISCDEAEARNLLLHAGHYPGVVASIHKALRSAGLPLEVPELPERDDENGTIGEKHTR